MAGESMLDDEFLKIVEETRAESAGKARAAMGENFGGRGKDTITPGKNAGQIAESTATSQEGNLGRTVGKVISKAGSYLARATGAAGGLGLMMESGDLNIGEDQEMAAIRTASDAARAKADQKVNVASIMPETLPDIIALDQTAKTNNALAKVKINETAAQAGVNAAGYSYVLGQNQRLLQTFGKKTTTSKNAAGETVVTVPVDANPVPPELRGPAIDERQIVADQIAGFKGGFDIGKEYGMLRNLDGDARLDRANMLLVNIEQQMGAEQEKIRGVAAQQAGVNDAKASLDANTKLDRAFGRVNQLTQETLNARNTLNESMIIANKYEADLIAGNPQLRKLKGFHDAITRDISFQGPRIRSKEIRDERIAIKEETVNAEITPEKYLNGRLALGIKEATTAGEEQKIKETIFNNAGKDKLFKAVLEIDRNNVFAYLVHKDPKVRQYAFKIAQGLERGNRNLGPDAPDPANIVAIKGLVENPDAWIQKNMNLIPASQQEDMKKGLMLKSGKEKTDQLESNKVQMINIINDQLFKRSYDKVNNWTFTNPSIKKVVDAAAKVTKEGKLNMEDAFHAVVNTEIKMPNGAIMTYQDKKQAMLSALQVTVENDKKSFLSPDPENYRGEYVDRITNGMNRAYIRKIVPFSNIETSDLIPGAPLMLKGAEALGNLYRTKRKELLGE